ncbi:MAG: FtsX-like permease family protein, partial [Chloroflexota bacterium]
YGLGTGRYGSQWLDKVMGQVQGLPRMMTLALRNTFRRAGRVALTEITLTSAGAIFMMVVTTGYSFNQTIDKVWSSWGFDVLFIFRDYQRIAEMEPVTWSQPGANQVEMWAWVQAKAHQPGQTDPSDQYDIQLRGIPHKTTMFNPTLTEGRLLNDADGHAVVFNQKLAGEMGLKVGDPVVVDLGGGKEATWTIVGLVSDIGVGGIQNTAFMWREVLNADMGQSGRATVVQIGTAEDTLEAQQSLKKRLQTHFESQNIEVVLAVGQIENKQMAGALWDLIGGLLQLMTFLVAVVGSIGLSGTLSINVMERRREIGVMRAVGASSGDVAVIFMGEGLLLGVLSWLQAVPLSMIGARFFVDALGQALSFPFAYHYSYNGMWVWLLIILVLSVVASWLPARRATQISVRESLSYE